MAEGVIKASRRNPCPICGKYDWDMWTPSKDGIGFVHFCHRTDYQDCIGDDGRNYIFIKEAGNAGAMFVEEEDYILQRNLWMEQSGKKVANFDENQIREYKSRMLQQYKSIVPMDVKTEKVRPAEQLDIVYRAFLSLLLLESNHRKALEAEWKSYYKQINDNFLIRSIPIPDYMRYQLKGYNYVNEWRKGIVAKLIELIGSEDFLRGVPGFYKKNGIWTFANISGIVFPIYDGKGRIIRIRVKDNFPLVEGFFQDILGVYYFDTKALAWYFIDKESNKAKQYDKSICVYPLKSPQRALISLTKDNVPPGKVSGKYKNFSSYIEKYEDNEWVNSYDGGSRSGVACGLYMKDGDNCEIVFATEGEKKAMVMNSILNIPTITVPGVGLFEYITRPGDCGEPSILDTLVARGMKKLVIVYDADKSVNVEVLRNERKFVLFMKSKNIDTFVGEWNEKFGKGSDDALLNGVSIDVYEYECEGAA